MDKKTFIKNILPYGIVDRMLKHSISTQDFEKQFKYFAGLCSDGRFKCRWEDRWPCLNDATVSTGFDRHYIYHTAWAARVLKETNPVKHVDISSSLYFCSIVSAFVPVEFYDYRPAKLELSSLITGFADLMKLGFADNSIQSLSCMHTVEHVGLGRYGDAVDVNGDLKAMKELTRVLAHGGDLLFVVPVGKESLIQFNAHRIYTKEQVVREFNDLGLNLHKFTLIPEYESDGGLIDNPHDSLLKKQRYACGCFWFKK